MTLFLETLLATLKNNDLDRDDLKKAIEGLHQSHFDPQLVRSLYADYQLDQYQYKTLGLVNKDHWHALIKAKQSLHLERLIDNYFNK